ncbi:MAG: class I SAM-dependent methyltransferase [Polyangiales bacterium]
MRERTDWDAFWRFEQIRRDFDPLDARRWKSDSQRALKSLYPGRPLLLDSTAGLGDHTVNLAEQGFQVEACDTSDVALTATKAALAAAGIEDVPVFRGEWAELQRPGRYDLIFNDAIHWVYEESEMRRVARGLLEALKPGGSLVYFYADKSKPGRDVGARQLESDWADMSAPREAWHYEGDSTSLRLSLTAERGEGCIDEEHTYELREGETHSTHYLTMRHVYHWDWFHLTPLLEEVGFTNVRSEHFENVKGRTYAMNRASRPT